MLLVFFENRESTTVHMYAFYCSTWGFFNNSCFICPEQRLYKASFEKNRGNFKYTSDSPFFHTAKNASILINEVSCLILSPITVIEKLVHAAKTLLL